MCLRDACLPLPPNPNAMKYLLLFFICGFPYVLSAQQLVISADKMNKAYVGIETHLTIVSGSCGFDALSVTVDNGTIAKIEGCSYRYTPTQTGNAELSIFENSKGTTTLIGKNTFRVKAMPSQVASVGGRAGGGYPLNQFKAQVGLTVLMEDFQYDKPYYKVISFTFKTYRNRVLLAEVPVSGNIFNAECQKAMAALAVGDNVIVENIKITCPNCTIGSLGAISFTMK